VFFNDQRREARCDHYTSPELNDGLNTAHFALGVDVKGGISLRIAITVKQPINAEVHLPTGTVEQKYCVVMRKALFRHFSWGPIVGELMGQPNPFQGLAMTV
jgi:hypothetical protein